MGAGGALNNPLNILGTSECLRQLDPLNNQLPMKHFYLLLIFISISTTSFAQFRFGVKIAMTQNDLFFIRTQGSDKSVTPFLMYSMNGGVVANYKFNNVFALQSELIFNTLGKNYSQERTYTNINGDEITMDTDVKIRLHYLEIPLCAKFTLFGNQKVNLDLLAGAFAGYTLSAKQKTDDESFQKVSGDYTTLNAGYTVGVGLSVMKQRLFFELRGNRGLVNINASDGTKINTFQMQYAVGYYLFRGDKR